MSNAAISSASVHDVVSEALLKPKTLLKKLMATRRKNTITRYFARQYCLVDIMPLFTC